MSDRFYTTIELSGHNADAAAKSAMEAFISHDGKNPVDDGEGFVRGWWVDGDDPFAPCYYSTYDSGEGAVVIVTEVSRQFPETCFHLDVDGSCGEGYQGPVLIQNGNVTDGRCKEISWGDGTVEFYTDLSRKFPEERFRALDENHLREAYIQNGTVAFVEPVRNQDGTFHFVKPEWKRPERVRVRMTPEQLVPYLIREFRERLERILEERGQKLEGDISMEDVLAPKQ